MTNHKVLVHSLEDGYKAICSCRAASNTEEMFWQAEDWSRDHLAVVERVKAHLAPKNISLEKQRDYFREQANNEANSPGDRRLWAALADELDLRCNDQGPTNEGQEKLF